jgi:hypothetical protein
MLRLISSVFACSHRNQSFPQTDRRTKETTVTCLLCACCWFYDWQTMRRGARVRPAVQAASQERQVA